MTVTHAPPVQSTITHTPLEWFNPGGGAPWQIHPQPAPYAASPAPPPGHGVAFHIGTDHVVCACGTSFATPAYASTVLPCSGIDQYAAHLRTLPTETPPAAPAGATVVTTEIAIQYGTDDPEDLRANVAEALEHIGYLRNHILGGYLDPDDYEPMRIVTRTVTTTTHATDWTEPYCGRGPCVLSAHTDDVPCTLGD